MKTCILCQATETKKWFSGPKCSRCYRKDRNQIHNPKRYSDSERKSKVLAQAKEYRQHNHSKILEYDRKRSTSYSRRLHSIKNRAKSIGRECTLTLEEYKTVVSNPCYYCGNVLYPPSVIGSGLDRINSSKGYTFDNVVSCCTLCNRIKSDLLTVEETKAVALLLISLRREASFSEEKASKTPSTFLLHQSVFIQDETDKPY